MAGNGGFWALLLVLGVLALGGVAVSQQMTIEEQRKKLTEQQRWIQYLEGRVSTLERKVNELQFNFYLNINQINEQVATIMNEIQALKSQYMDNPRMIQQLEDLVQRLQQIKRRKQEALGHFY